MKISTRFAATALTACLGLGGIAGPASASSERLPREDFPACSDVRKSYCIESVTFMEPGVNIPGIWLDALAPVTDVFQTSTAFPGRWSYNGFAATTRGYDGVYIKVGPANQYTDIMSISVEPAGKNSSGGVGRVVTNFGTPEAAVQSLSLDSGISVKVRLGKLSPGVTVAVANNAKVNKSMSGATTVLDFSGYPVTVPLHSSVRDCESEEGTSYAEVNQMMAVVAFTTGEDPFGVPGLSGDMLVSSNGVCQLSTPNWDKTTLQMSFTTAAPHFQSDGITPNLGFYRAFIPATDAAILYGITDPTDANSDLKLEIDSDIYGTNIAAKAVAGSKKGIIISYTNFQFSAPTFTLKAKNKAKFNKLKKQKTKAVVKKAIAKNKKNKK